MIWKVREYVEKYHMIESGDKIVVGVSGGADSIALLSLLLKLGRVYDISLFVVHVNHGIRRESADLDEQYVKRICEARELPFFAFHVDMRGYAKLHGMSEEEAGRILRRESFLKVAKEQGCNKIALAHHRDDNAETMLFHLLRGSGISGLSGIAPVNGMWIHPLLCADRTEIEEYLAQEQISFRVDETNADNVYARNRIRNVVLPEMEKINDQTLAHVSSAAESLRNLWEYIYPQIMEWKEKCFTGETLLKEEFERIPEQLKGYVVLEILGDVCGQKKDIESTHVEMVRGLLAKQVGKVVCLPYRMMARRSYEGIRFYRADACKEEIEATFEQRVLDREPGAVTFPENPFTKWFDYDIIQNTVEIRHRMAGDYITIDLDGHTQKVKQYLVNAKVPQEERDRIWLVADGDHVMWVVGYRQNQAYQVTENTKRVLEITYHGGTDDGRDS